MARCIPVMTLNDVFLEITGKQLRIKEGNMLHLLKYRFRLMIRNRVLLFWTLIFPMLLTTFFGMVLKDAYTGGYLQTVPIAVEQRNLRDVKAV